MSLIYLYSEIKGKIENAVKNLNFGFTSIFRPGFIENRDNDKRFVETIAGFIPFFPKVDAKDLARAIRIEAENMRINFLLIYFYTVFSSYTLSGNNNIVENKVGDKYC